MVSQSQIFIGQGIDVGGILLSLLQRLWSAPSIPRLHVCHEIFILVSLIWRDSLTASSELPDLISLASLQ
jgi:hypothetical protein